MNPYDVQPHPTIPGAYQATFGNGAPPITVTSPNIGGPKTASMPLAALKAMRGASPAQAQAIAAANPISVNGQPASQGIADPRVQQASAQGAGPVAATQQPMPQGQAPGGPRVGESLGYTMKAFNPATGKEEEGVAEWQRGPDGVLRPMVRVAGSRGSPGGLTPFGKQKTAHETETEQKIAEARAQQEAANEQARAAAQGQAEAELSFRKEQEQQAVNQANDQAAEADQIKKRVSDLDAKYQSAREAANAGSVDAGRYMRGNWMAALGAMFGAIGASAGRHPNYVMDFINNNIDRDIRSQEKEIEIKGRAADNALADLVREQGSLKDAKMAMRQILTEKAANKSAAIAAQYKGQAIGAAAEQAAAQAAESHALQDQERKQSYLDRTLHDRTYYSPGSAGRAGGLLTPTMGSMAGKQEGEIKGRELALKERHEETRAGNEGKLGQRAASVVATARVARGAIQELADAMEMQRGEDGHFEEPSTATVIASKIPYSDTRQKVQALKNTLISEVGKAQTGGVLTEQAAHEMMGQVNGLSTPGEFAAFANHFDHTMSEVERQYRLVAKSAHGSDSGDSGTP